MTPFYDKGRKFVNKGEIDTVLMSFVQAMNVFDYHQTNVARLQGLKASPEFQKAYDELGRSHDFKRYIPIPASDISKAKLIIPAETDNLADKLRTALKNKDLRTWNKLKAAFVENAEAEWHSNLDFISTTVYRQSIDTLLQILASDGSFKDRRDALLKLAELDPVFLTAPGAASVVDRASSIEDIEFKSKLSKAINPARRTRAFENQRQRYALYMLSALGYKDKSYREWSEFFKYYNSQLGDNLDSPRNKGFWTFETPDTVRIAIKGYGIPKNDPRRAKQSGN